MQLKTVMKTSIENLFILMLGTIVFLSGCANHKYIVLKSEKPRQPEKLQIKIFTIAGFVPIDNKLDPQKICPGRKVRMINMYDSGLDGIACGVTLFLMCPHTVGVECEN